mmetsp:Transcript_13724/g.35258  ORF Transcript_13724/g.35258 Transcript_13724/m.35258 type:complete len:242 (+) Transcript_13724:175-900(+)
MAGLPALTSLDVSGCRNLSNGGLRDLAASRPGLRHLRLAWCREITSSGLLGLSPLTELRSLALDEVKQVRDEGVASLVALSSLTSLSLRWCRRVGDAGVAPLAALAPTLTSLHLDGCLALGDAAFAAIAQLRRLTALDAASTAVTDAGVARLGALPALVTLSLANCGGVTATSLPALPPSLRSLNLARCGALDAVQPDALACLAHLAQLNLLYCRPSLRAAIAGLHAANPAMEIHAGTGGV